MTCANHPDRPVKAFCQNCGKPLCVECTRPVGAAVFCEPCLEQRLAAADAQRANASKETASGPSFTAVPPPVPPPPPGANAAPPVAGTANPVIALLLGFIPGVGAMYNGQYAKGIVHLIVFATLVSLSDQNSIFGLFLTGWIFYQAIEAYQTARARRDGTPLPNPFNLNDIGERLGFLRNAPTPATQGVPPPPQASAPSGVTPEPTAAAQDPYAPFPIPPLPPRSSEKPQFPTGALILIGLGVLFLLGNTHWLASLPVHLLLPFLLIGFGIWIFIRRMTVNGLSLAGDGSAAYRIRTVRALDSSVWIVLVGVLFLLDSLRILTWGHSWPLFIIVGGALALIRRNAYSSLTASPAYSPSSAPPASAAPTAGSTSVPHAAEPDQDGPTL